MQRLAKWFYAISNPIFNFYILIIILSKRIPNSKRDYMPQNDKQTCVIYLCIVIYICLLEKLLKNKAHMIIDKYSFFCNKKEFANKERGETSMNRRHETKRLPKIIIHEKIEQEYKIHKKLLQMIIIIFRNQYFL